MLALLAAGFARADALTSVAIDLTALDDVTYKRIDGLALEKRLVLRLVQDGFAVVAANAPADVKLSLTQADSRLILRGVSRSKTDQREIALGDEPLAELHLELAQKSAELAKNCTPPPPPVPPPPRVPAPLSPLTAAGSAGLEFRPGGLDPTVALAVRYGRLFGGELVVALIPSRGDGISLLEARVLLGPSMHLELPHHLAFEASLCAGAQLHTWLFDDTSLAVRSGAIVDFVAGLPVSLTFWPFERFGLGLRVTPGITAGHSHSQGSQLVWFRGPAWVDATGVAVLRL